ncbi:MAG: ferrous iron transport protein B [Lachnospiraceae bacterium]|jgi:ferrous iron transport protein B|nr:ferrous iron transport protein B [Lachnospiraceae bacterium]MEE3460638.1 ferrous iron transport protein B [Lachnospiraceae bacterium]
MTLKDLKTGQSAIVSVVADEGALRQHLLDMGLIPGVRVTLIKYAPMGDPMEIRLHGYELTLRLSDAENIEVEEAIESPVHDDKETGNISKAEEKPDHLDNPYLDTVNNRIDRHPGLGEGGIFHDKKTEHPLPEGQTITFALAGNQNSGKTTLFNQLTGSNQHVGNFPGVTVDRKSGSIKGHPNTLVTDLPGIYSMSPYSAEEIVSRQFILNEKPTGIINIVDATNIERNLYLTMQLIELNVPMVVALNMMDEVQGNGGSVRINKMEQLLGVPVVPISAAKNEGVKELISHAIHVAKYQERPLRQDFCYENDHGGAVHRALHAVMHLIQDHAERAGIPVRFAATKVIEGDELVLEALKLTQNEKETLEHIILQMEDERGLDRSASIADMRFAFIENLVSYTVIKPRESKEHERSRLIDRVLTGKFTAIPAFILIMGLVFYLTFNLLGGTLQELLARAVDACTYAADRFFIKSGVNPVLHSLITEGIFTGLGSVISFLPIIVILFFFLSLLEDTGYMARIAFVMDKLLRKIGLSGRSIVPMLVGFGCSVPAVMSSRTLPSDRDRKMTIMLVPFMSCTAKLPIYGYFTAAFFPGHGAVIMICLYIMGILTGILTALVSKNTYFKGEAVPFVMELPNYRLPSAKNVMQLLWEKSWDFIQRAFSIILIATIVIWFLQHFSITFSWVNDSADSMLAMIAGIIAPVFKPLGFGSWKVTTALISGFMAKESVVATLNVLFGSSAEVLAAISKQAAFALLTFCLLYTPCVAAIASIKRELGGRWAAFIVIFQCLIAWVMGFIVYLIAGIFM